MAANNSFTLQGATPYPSLSSYMVPKVNQISTGSKTGNMTTTPATLPQTTPKQTALTNATLSSNPTSTRTVPTATPTTPTATAPRTSGVMTSSTPGTPTATPYGRTATTPGTNTPGTNTGFFSGNSTGSNMAPAPTAPTTPGTTYSGLIGGLAGAPAQNKAYADRAQEIASNAGNQISDIGQTGARARAGYLTTGTTPVGEGNAAVLNQSIAAQQQAVAQGADVALKGTAQGLTAQGQAQSALGTAAGLAKPELSQYGQTYYNPLTGTTAGGTVGVAPNDPFYQTMQQYARNLATGQVSGIPGNILSNPALSAQLQQMASQLNPNFNYNTALGTGSAQQQMTQNAATAQQNAALGTYGQLYPEIAQLQTQLSNVDQFGQLLLQTPTNGGISPTDSRYANQLINQLQTQFSQNAPFMNTLAALQGQVRSLLATGAGALPTDVSEKANAILDGNLKYSELPSVLTQIQKEGQIMLQNKMQTASQAYQAGQYGGGASGGTSGGVIQTSAGPVNPNF